MMGEAGTSAQRPGRAVGLDRLALFAMLGFSAGLPFYMFSTVLALRLARHGVGIVVIGFFAWVTLLPTVKFLWAPLIDRYAIPGFSAWGRRPGWIMVAQLGITASMVAMAVTSDDASLAVTALFAVCLAFWTTTLEIAADAWRITLYPTREQQGPVVAATIWGYRTAMVAAGSGALIFADHGGWTFAYLLIAAAAFVPFPIMAALPAANRAAALAKGLGATAVIVLAVTALFAGFGWVALAAAQSAGIGERSNVTAPVLGLCMLPFLAMAVMLPKIRREPADGPLRGSPALGPYVDFFWRYGPAALAVMAFVSLYRMGDVLALTLAKPLANALGYSLTQIGVADGAVALAASMAGVALAGWIATRWRASRMLALGAAVAAVGNFGLAWLAWQPAAPTALYLATAIDQFGNGFAGTVFVVYLSLLVNPEHAGAQYAFLSGFAFLLPRLLAGASGAIQLTIGWDGFFVLSGALSLAAIVLLPWVTGLVPREEP